MVRADERYPAAVWAIGALRVGAAARRAAGASALCTSLARWLWRWYQETVNARRPNLCD
jgi:hypothetical protein